MKEMDDGETERIKKEVQEMKEKIEQWIKNPSSKIRKIEPWDRYGEGMFDEAAKKLVEGQMRAAGFEGNTGKTEKISYGLIKLKRSLRMRGGEEGIMFIQEESSPFNFLGSKAGVLGFEINPLTKELIGISFYDDSPTLIGRHLKGDEKGGFYFGSTEYTLPTNDMSGLGGFNHFVIPTGNEYRKYYEMAKKVWKHYLTNVASV